MLTSLFISTMTLCSVLERKLRDDSSRTRIISYSSFYYQTAKEWWKIGISDVKKPTRPIFVASLWKTISKSWMNCWKFIFKLVWNANNNKIICKKSDFMILLQNEFFSDSVLKWISVVEHVVVTAFRRHKKKFADSDSSWAVMKNFWSKSLMTISAILMSTETFRHQILLFLCWSSNIEYFLNIFVLGPHSWVEAPLLAKNFN